MARLSKHSSMASSVAENDDVFPHTPRKTIAELKASRQVEKCIVMCSIAGVDSDMGWYYLSCRECSRKVQRVMIGYADYANTDDAFTYTYFCGTCNSHSPTLLPSSSETKFLIFDNLATQLIREPCLQLTEPINNEMEQPDALPEAITKLFGETYLFKVGIEQENLQYKLDTFKILEIININQNLEEINVAE